MRKLFFVAVMLLTTAVSAMAQPVTGEKKAQFLLSNTDMQLLVDMPQLMVINGLEESIESITCTKGSNTWILFGVSPDKTVKRNIGQIQSGTQKIIDVQGWSGYCPAGVVAHTRSSEYKGELNVPNNFDKSSRVTFWVRNAI